MSLFKTDPLLAFCRLIAWFILVSVIAGGVFTLAVAATATVNGDFVVKALRLSYPKLQQDGLMLPFGLSMLFMTLAFAVLSRFMLHLLAIIRSVASGAAFTQLNASRIRAMAWLSLAGMPVGLAMGGALAKVVDLIGPRDPEGGIRIATFDGGFSSGQILMTLLLFVLARLFAQAATMRDEIEGTV